MSNQDDTHDKFRAVLTGELDNLDAVNRRMDLLTGEVHLGFEMLANRIMPKLETIQSAIEDLAIRQTRTEGDVLSLARRVSALEKSSSRRIKAQKAKRK